MGKKTGFHPVSLHVIRGAMEFMGFGAGQIKKIAEFPEQEKAVYSVRVERWPNGADTWPPKTWRKQLQHCFMDDIKVTTIRLSTDSNPIAVITVQLHQSPMDKVLEAAGESDH